MPQAPGIYRFTANGTRGGLRTDLQRSDSWGRDLPNGARGGTRRILRTLIRPLFHCRWPHATNPGVRGRAPAAAPRADSVGYWLRKSEREPDFLGYTFRYDRDLGGRPWRYLNLFPSKQAVARERAVLRVMTGSRMGFKPIPRLVRALNRQVTVWAA